MFVGASVKSKESFTTKPIQAHNLSSDSLKLWRTTIEPLKPHAKIWTTKRPMVSFLLHSVMDDREQKKIRQIHTLYRYRSIYLIGCVDHKRPL